MARALPRSRLVTSVSAAVFPSRPDDGVVPGDEYVRESRRLIGGGDRLQRQPSLAGLRTWIAWSDELLQAAWGSMDRYHLAWLMVGRPAGSGRRRAMAPG